MFSYTSHPPALKGWHCGVREIQEKLDFQDFVADDYAFANSYLTQSDRIFHSHHIHFLPFATLDGEGRVWSSILAGAEGAPGFIYSPDEHSLIVDAQTWQGDPTGPNLAQARQKGQKSILTAGVGVELTSRRRNKVAGDVTDMKWESNRLQLRIAVTEALGNCPKYISLRQLMPHTDTQPILAASNFNLGKNDTLPLELIEFIQARDTVFLASSYLAPPKTEDFRPSHLGQNHRGGRPGFVRVRSDRLTLVLPDYSGNRQMTTLGNIEVTHVAGLCLPDFLTGDVLYVTGEAQNLIGESALKIMARQKVITLIKVTGYSFVKNALPFRHVPQSLDPSPYSPPVRYLTEESDQIITKDASVSLLDVKFYSLDDDIGNVRDKRDSPLATFTFKATENIDYKAGQFVVLDCLPIIGQISYAHMTRKGNESSVNDDGVRTWTISSAPELSSPQVFSVTMRQIEGGRVTPRLFGMAEHMLTCRALGESVPEIQLPLLGIGGNFVLPDEPSTMVWIAGGIGLTPFLSFLSDILQQKRRPSASIESGVSSNAKDPVDKIWNIHLLVSTREPQTITKLLLDVIKNGVSSHDQIEKVLKLDIKLFSSVPQKFSTVALGKKFERYHSFVTFEPKSSRILTSDLKSSLRGEEASIKNNNGGNNEKKTLPRVYMCGPPAFETSILKGLSEAGVSDADVSHESFNF